MLENDLYNLPIQEISYEMIEAFCQLEREEDIDLDYKSDWPSDLDKILCAFANTQGGIVLIGVEEENKTRRPKCPPMGVVGTEEALRQKALNIAFDRVYPPIIPEVQVCALPESEGRSVVVIRVTPTRHMHAVDRRRKVYIRTADHNRSYELASISDLEWLWSQREKDSVYRDEILSAASSRAESDLIGLENNQFIDAWTNFPRLVVTSLPTFPTISPIIRLYKLMEMVSSLGTIQSPWKDIARSYPYQGDQWRSIANGVCSKNRGNSQNQHYVEIEQHGFFYSVTTLALEDFPPSHDSLIRPYGYILSTVLLAYLDLALSYTAKFYKLAGFRWPINLTAYIDKTYNTYLSYNLPGSTKREDRQLSLACTDQQVGLFDRELTKADISTEHDSLLQEAAGSMFWAYGLNWDDNQLFSWLEKLTNR
jgi:hypothetical protein